MFSKVFCSVFLNRFFDIIFYDSTNGNTCDLDLGFVIDESGSISSRDFTKSIEFVNSISKQFTIDVHRTRVSIITFSGDAKQHFEFRDYYGYSRSGLDYYLRHIRQRGMN